MKAQILKIDGLKLWMTVVVLMTAVAVFAEDSKEAERGHGPCREDAEKFCAGIKPGGGAIRKCMREHKDQLSDACKAKIQKVREKRKERRKERAEHPNS